MEELANFAAGRDEAAAGLLDGQTVAAVDLGSNSFHVVVARVAGGRLHMVDRLRERVRLAAGLDEQGRLTEAKIREAMECLNRLGDRLRGMPAGSVRVVGTNTLRKAGNAAEFLARAEAALGHPIEVVSGAEEARLIYLGVSHSLAESGGRRLVIDIGGGSTECIVGERFEILAADSLEMGCVNFSLRFFPGGELRKEHFRRAELAASLEFETIQKRVRELKWKEAVGSSGTIRAVEELLNAAAAAPEGVSYAGLSELRRKVLEAGHVERLEIPGLQADRQAVLPGGLAILIAAFRILDIETMQTSTGALREGLLYDLLGRIQQVDQRDQTVRVFAERFHVDAGQAERVERSAQAFREQVAADWGLGDEDARRFLSWAARLHEIGAWLSYSGYHRHGAYVLENAAMPGFSKRDQGVLACLVLGHRRKPDPAAFAKLPAPLLHKALRLCVLLRLAVRLNRSRQEDPVAGRLRLAASGGTLVVRFPRGTLEERPLISADLDEEKKDLEVLGFTLKVEG